MKTIFRNFISVLRRFKMATFLNVTGLAVAIAVSIVIMMQVTYDFGFNRSIKDAASIYRVEMELDGRRVAVVSWPFHDQLVKASPHILGGGVANTMYAYDYIFQVEHNGTKQSYKEKTFYTLPPFLELFDFEMVEGTRDALLDPNQVLVPQSLAKRLFGGEPAVGKRLQEEDGSKVIGGVYKDFPKNSSISNSVIQQLNKNNSTYDDASFSFASYIKLDNPESADGLMETLMPLIDMSGVRKVFEGEILFHLTPLKEIHFDTGIEFDTTEKTAKQTLWILMAIALAILTIAGINFTNYNMALTPLRIKSINTQKVLGASQTQLRAVLLAEGVVVCFIAWLIALGMVYLLSLTSFTTLLDADMTLGKHLPLLMGSAILALLLGLFAGLYPSWYITSFAPVITLKGTFGLSPQGRSLRNSLMGMQFVASFILIVAALFMYLQNNFMRSMPVGYEKDQILVTDMNDRLNGQREAFVNELKAQAGISDVSFSRVLISGDDNYNTNLREVRGQNIMYQEIPVDINFLEMMGIQPFEGRNFTKSDQENNDLTEIYIFNKCAKEEYGLEVGDKPVDNIFGTADEENLIVGFVPDINVMSLRKAIQPMAFLLIKENNWKRREWAYIKVKAGSDMYAAMNHLKATLQHISPDYPFQVRFFDEVINDLYIKEQSISALITWFSLIAVLISIVGVFGLVVFESEYKRKEIGVRKVLGSTTAEILAMFNKRYIRILAICFLVAAPIAWYAVNSWLQGFAYKTPIYWWVFALSFLFVTMITSATVTFQSWQVANANPVDSIKA
ncbi:ABC transporter permease [Parabacteroides sp. OttesenSCG-928-N08]|nr:ABC transporter permease [Parabacteroides sp. OttesenSCG-928-N08]